MVSAFATFDYNNNFSLGFVLLVMLGQVLECVSAVLLM